MKGVLIASLRKEAIIVATQVAQGRWSERDALDHLGSLACQLEVELTGDQLLEEARIALASSDSLVAGS